MDFYETWQYASIQCPRPNICFWVNLTTMVCVLRADPMTKMTAIAADWLIQFRILPCNRCIDFDETWQEWSTQRPLPISCYFSCRSVNKIDHPGLRLADTFLAFPLQPLSRYIRNWTESKFVINVYETGQKASSLSTSTKLDRKQVRYQRLRNWTETRGTTR